MMLHFVWAATGFGFPAKLKHMGAFSRMVGIAVRWVLALGLVLWAADVFFREVEERTKWVMYWIQGICFTKKSSAMNGWCKNRDLIVKHLPPNP
jgi:hypothetical protein